MGHLLDEFGHSEDWIEVERAFGVDPGMNVVAPEKVVGLADRPRLVIAHGSLRDLGMKWGLWATLMWPSGVG